MEKFSFSSLRVRLLIIVILAMIPAIGLIQYNASEQRKLAISNAHEEAVRLARVAVYQHKNLIDDTRVLLTMLAQVPEVRSGSREQCNALMANLLTKYPYYANLGVIGLDGYTICNAVDPKSRAYTGDRAWFKRAIKTKNFSIGDYIIGRVTNRAILGCGYPILDQAGEVQSFVLAAIDISWFNRLAAEVKMPEGATFMLIDRNRTILTYHPDPEKWVGKTLPESPLIKAILTQGEGVMEAPGLDGIMRLYAFLPLGELPEGEVYVKIGIPKDYIMSPINRATTRNLFLLVIIGLLAFVAVWFSSNFFILHPTKKLLMTIQGLSAGNLSVRINPPYEKGELGQLAYAFDQMAELLEKRESKRKRAEQALKKSEALLKETQQISKLGGWELDVETGKITWTDEVYRIYGVSTDYDPSNIPSDMSFYKLGSFPILKEAFQKALDKGEPYDLDLELEFTNAKGEDLWVRTIGKPTPM